MSDFKWGKNDLQLEKAMELLQMPRIPELDEEAIKRLQNSRKHVETVLDSDEAHYGINTGFGPLCDTQVSAEQSGELQQNLLLSHAVGVGQPIAAELSKLMLICKIHALCRGYSGVRLLLVERLFLFLEKDWIPVVPEQGSVGASGDLAPLSHLFLPLIGEGEFWVNGERHSAQEVYSEAGIAPLRLSGKEGLALINGTQFILAHTLQGLDKMKYLLDLADLAGAMTLEGYQGSSSPFHEGLHQCRPFHGSQVVAARMRAFLEHSENLASHEDCDRVQDPYSVRCIPQVHGASRNAFAHLKELAEIESNSVTDNPLVFSAEEIISGGNFHGQPLAMALDYATVAASELGNISDRRSYLLLEGRYGLPRFLTRKEGLHSGMMIPQYTTAALVSENKSLCFPSSADSIPTSLGQEDHVSMGSISGRKFNQVLGNLEKILAIEILMASQALEFRRPLRFSDKIEENLRIVRQQVPPLEEDRLLKPDIDALVQLVRNRQFLV